MKNFIIIFCVLLLGSLVSVAQTMQATIKPGVTPRTVDIYIKPSASFTQANDAMLFAILIPATATPAPSPLGATGPVATTGAVTAISGLQPTILTNNSGLTGMQMTVSLETVGGVSYYVYAFNLTGTAPATTTYTAGTEQLMLSVQFNGCTSGCTTTPNECMANLANGGAMGNAFFYYQANTLGDLTDYANPFYNGTNATAVNGGSSNFGDVLSTNCLNAPVYLPLHLLSFTAVEQNCNSQLQWVTENEVNTSHFEIEQSTDAVSYGFVSRVEAQGSGNGKTYQYTTQPSGVTYYRLKMVDKNGAVSYSQVIVVHTNCSGKTNYLDLYPNPVTDNDAAVMLSFKVDYKGRAQVLVSNTLGQVIINTPVTVINGINAVKISCNKLISKGVYYIKLTDDQGNLISPAQKLVKQ